MSDKTIRYNPQVTTLIEQKKKSRLPYILISIAAVVVVTLLVLLFTGAFKGKDYESPTLRQMHRLVAKIRNLETDVNDKQGEIRKLMKDYTEKTGDTLPTMTAINLSDTERKLLEEKINNETDVSLKSLLSDILDKNKEISELKGQIKLLENLLPKPHVVSRGENHYQIAMNYLLNEKGVEKDRAIKLIERTALFEPLIPEFKVWNFHTGQEYGTFITQGDAPISPNEIRRQAERVLVEGRDKAIAEKDKLAEEIELLMQRRDLIISQVDQMNQEKKNLIDKLSELSESNVVMQRTLNSVHYLLDLKRKLLDKDVLKSGFLRSPRLQDVSPAIFTQSVDLRDQDRIYVSASQFSLTKLRKIVVYPRFFKKGDDYEIQFDDKKQNAIIRFKVMEKFKNERIVIAVE